MTSLHLRQALLASALFCLCATELAAQKGFEIVSGKAFDSAIPKDFYLEGNAIPVQKRNAVLVQSPAGARVVFALIDTTGYSANIQTKYVGMIIAEGDVSVCGHRVGVGSYGFGWTRPDQGVDQPGKLSLYNQAGASVAECTTPRDAKLAQPRPLQVTAGKTGPARLYYGRHFAELR